MSTEVWIYFMFSLILVEYISMCRTKTQALQIAFNLNHIEKFSSSWVVVLFFACLIRVAFMTKRWQRKNSFLVPSLVFFVTELCTWICMWQDLPVELLDLTLQRSTFSFAALLSHLLQTCLNFLKIRLNVLTLVLPQKNKIKELFAQTHRKLNIYRTCLCREAEFRDAVVTKEGKCHTTCP